MTKKKSIQTASNVSWGLKDTRVVLVLLIIFFFFFRIVTAMRKREFNIDEIIESIKGE